MDVKDLYDLLRTQDAELKGIENPSEEFLKIIEQQTLSGKDILKIYNTIVWDCSKANIYSEIERLQRQGTQNYQIQDNP